MKINSFDKDIQSVFESSFYVIPRFQRPYSWDKENIVDFWQDTIANTETDYFIGSIVVFKKKDKTYGIVDGQQRLSTITMILCLIRDYYKKHGYDDLAEGIHSLVERKNIKNQAKFVLQTETSFPFFQEYIQKFRDADIEVEIKNEEKTLQTAYQQLENLISGSLQSVESDPSKKDTTKKKEIQQKLNLFRDKVLSLKVIFVELDNDDDAYVIFETLNTRGKDLSPSDLVKNLLTRFLKPNNPDIDSVKIVWGRIVENIENAPGEVSTNNFLQHYWLSAHEYTSSKKLYKCIRGKIKRTNAKEFLDDLEYQSKIYRYIFEPSNKKWKNEESKIRNALVALDLFNVRQPIPLVLAIMKKYEKKKITKRQTEKILTIVENFIFKYTAIVTTQSTGGLSMMYSSYARRLTQAETTSDKNRVLQDIKSRLSELSPSREEFSLGFREIKYTNKLTKDRKLVRYILSKLHKELNLSSTIDYNLMTIEHLYPQSKITEKTYNEKLVGCLGNLILISPDINTKLSDKTFHDKKRILTESNYTLDELILNSDKWKKRDIIERLNWMCDKAFDDYWRI